MVMVFCCFRSCMWQSKETILSSNSISTTPSPSSSRRIYICMRCGKWWSSGWHYASSFVLTQPVLSETRENWEKETQTREKIYKERRTLTFSCHLIFHSFQHEFFFHEMHSLLWLLLLRVWIIYILFKPPYYNNLPPSPLPLQILTSELSCGRKK